MIIPLRRMAFPLAAAVALPGSYTMLPGNGVAQIIPAAVPPESRPSGPTYADIAGLADGSPLVVRGRVRKLVRVEDERARAPAPGTARFYVMAETVALLTGASPIGQSFAYLVDLPVDGRGKPFVRKKDEVIVFARPVSGRPGELQLVRPNAQIAGGQGNETRLRAILTELLAPGAPARVTGVRELAYVPGTLAGEGETQIFLTTADGSAASVTVRHQPNQPPRWGASFSELVAEVGHPPQRETVQWYRLACFLPQRLPGKANMSEGEEARGMAEADYRLVMDSLGPCPRTL